MKTIIIDDEQHVIDNLKVLLETHCNHLKLSGDACSIEDGIQIIKKNNPDLIFLDIEMGAATGFDLLKKIPEPDFHIIFLTAFNQYGIRAIKKAGLDYLLKPFDINELKTAVYRAESYNPSVQRDSLTRLLNSLEKEIEQDKLALHSMEGISLINVCDILYCKTENNYLHFFCTNGIKYFISKSLSKYEDFLVRHHFVRIHHSYIVNMRHVKQYLRKDGGIAILSDGTELPVSVRKREAFIKQMDAYQI